MPPKRAASSAIPITTGASKNPWRASLRSSSWRAGRRVRHGEQPAVLQIQTLGFFTIERPGAAPIEDRDLVAVFIHCAVAIDTFRYGQRRATGVVCRDQLGCRLGTETEITGLLIRREQLHDAQAVPAIGHIGEGACGGHTELHIARIT